MRNLLVLCKPMFRLLGRTARLIGSGAGVALAATGILTVTATAAWGDRPNPSACHGLYHGDPPGSLRVNTSVPVGTTLRPGDTVDITATWGTGDWPRPELHKVLHCPTVDRELDFEGSTQEKPTANDGTFAYTLTVPPGARDEICDRVRLSGRMAPGTPLVVQKGNTVCFDVAGDPPVSAGSVIAPEQPPAPTVSGVDTAAATPETSIPRTVGDAEIAPPSPNPAAGFALLPRTGLGALPLAGVGALAIVLGVALRRRARPSQ